jgi:hypothetical protein
MSSPHAASDLQSGPCSNPSAPAMNPWNCDLDRKQMDGAPLQFTAAFAEKIEGWGCWRLDDESLSSETA